MRRRTIRTDNRQCLRRFLCGLAAAAAAALLPLGAMAEEAGPDGYPAVADGYVEYADTGSLRLYASPAGDIAVSLRNGQAWYSAMLETVLPHDSVSESQLSSLTAPLIVEYTLLNNRSEKSERQPLQSLGTTAALEKIDNGVKITYKASTIALEVDLHVTAKKDAVTVSIPEDGIREGVGLEATLETRMTAIRENIDFIYGTIDDMLADDALSAHRKSIREYRSAFDKYVDQIESITSVVDIEYEINLATTLMQETENLFKGGVGVTGVFNGIARDSGIDDAVRKTYAAMRTAVETKFTQTKLLSQQLGTIKYGAVVTLSVLPNFGALGDRDDGYVFYPDGSGAISYAKEDHPAYQHFYQRDVYSTDQPDIYSDYSLSEMGAERSLLPVYGVKRGDAAYVAAITKGAEHAAIEYYPSGLDVNVHRAGARVRCRRVAAAYAEGQSRRSKYELERFAVPYEVTFMFLSGNQADYSGMAVRYRQYLLDSGQLGKSALIGEEPAVALNLLMGVQKYQFLFNTLVPMTTYGQAEDILRDLQAGGAENLVVNLQGWTKEGYNPWQAGSGKAAGALGGATGLSRLGDYARQAEIPLFLQGNYATAAETGSQFDKADFAVGSNSLLLSPQYLSLYYLNPGAALRYLIDRAMPRIERFGAQGVMFEHTGHFLYYDYKSSAYHTRRDTAETWTQMMQESRDTLGLAAAEKAAAYAFGSLDWISAAPLESTGYIFTDESVPFYQIVVHGYIQYTGKPFNKFYDKQYEKLKAMEYGYVPIYTLTHEKTELLSGTRGGDLFSTRYEDWKDDILATAADYARLGDLTARPILSHERLENDVVRVRYEGGGALLINYGAAAAAIGGVSVDPMSFEVVS